MIGFARSTYSFLAAICIGSLAACGGGSGSAAPQGPSVPTTQPTPFPVTQATATALIDTYLDSDGRLLPAFAPLATNQIPNSGSAEYTDFLTGSVGGQDLVASLAIQTDFANSDLAAAASGFQRSDKDLSGTITGNGSITRTVGSSAPQLQITLTGTVDGQSTAILHDGALVVDAGDVSIVSVAGQAEGTFGTEIFEDGRFATE